MQKVQTRMEIMWTESSHSYQLISSLFLCGQIIAGVLPWVCLEVEPEIRTEVEVV